MDETYTKTDLGDYHFTKTMIVKKAKELFNLNLNENHTKKKLIRQFLEAQEEAKQEKMNVTPISEEDLEGYDHYMVRYVGHNSQLEHGVNATPTDTVYTFNKMEWVEVKQLDFERKYYPKMKGAIDTGRPPHWECARVNDEGDMQLLHRDFLDKLGDKEINGIGDFTGLTEFHLIQLQNAGIRSLREFQGIPDQWFINNMGLDNVTLAHWRDDAKRGIEASRQKIQEQLSEKL